MRLEFVSRFIFFILLIYNDERLYKYFQDHLHV